VEGKPQAAHPLPYWLRHGLLPVIGCESQEVIEAELEALKAECVVTRYPVPPYF